MIENDVNQPIKHDPMEKKKQIYWSPLVLLLQNNIIVICYQISSKPIPSFTSSQNLCIL